MRHVFIVVLVFILGAFLVGCGEQAAPAQSNPVPIPIPKYDKPASVPSPDPLPTSPSLEGK